MLVPNHISESERRQLIVIAEKAWKKAYAPYSKFKVGVALLTRQGNIFTGCNVENSSYGLSVCGERNAIASAISEEGADNFSLKAIAVANNQNLPCSPCGACRQVIAEFGTNVTIIFLGSEGYQTQTLDEMLPQKFSLSDTFITDSEGYIL